jgi:hypothetical protein
MAPIFGVGASSSTTYSDSLPLLSSTVCARPEPHFSIDKLDQRVEGFRANSYRVVKSSSVICRSEIKL